VSFGQVGTTFANNTNYAENNLDRAVRYVDDYNMAYEVYSSRETAYNPLLNLSKKMLK
jgi:hypothetical protein